MTGYRQLLVAFTRRWIVGYAHFRSQIKIQTIKMVLVIEQVWTKHKSVRNDLFQHELKPDQSLTLNIRFAAYYKIREKNLNWYKLQRSLKPEHPNNYKRSMNDAHWRHEYVALISGSYEHMNKRVCTLVVGNSRSYRISEDYVMNECVIGKYLPTYIHINTCTCCLEDYLYHIFCCSYFNAARYNNSIL